MLHVRCTRIRRVTNRLRYKYIELVLEMLRVIETPRRSLYISAIMQFCPIDATSSQALTWVKPLSNLGQLYLQRSARSTQLPDTCAAPTAMACFHMELQINFQHRVSV